MCVSRLMLITLRDVPSEADIVSHQLLIRGGFIRRLTGGIYAYMPLLWRVLKKITLIIEEELNSKGCLQTLLPQLQPSEIWEKSGRWKAYTEGEGIMFNLEDRQGKKLGLGPTHEEVITQNLRNFFHLLFPRFLLTTMWASHTAARNTNLTPIPINCMIR